MGKIEASCVRVCVWSKMCLYQSDKISESGNSGLKLNYEENQLVYKSIIISGEHYKKTSHC